MERYSDGAGHVFLYPKGQAPAGFTLLDTEKPAKSEKPVKARPRGKKPTPKGEEA